MSKRCLSFIDYLQEQELERQEKEARRAEEDAAAQAAAEPSASESEDGTNWEDMDLDAVRLPGLKEEPSTAEVAKRAAAEAAAEVGSGAHSQVVNLGWHPDD